MIRSYLNFINENSRNEPIKELRENKVCIILLGTPGVGKSHFIKNYIYTKNNIKTFSTDDVSYMFTKDHNKYRNGSSDLNISRVLKFIDTKQSFIYDTTGSHTDQIFKIVQKSKENSYKIIFIHIVGTLELSLKQNSIRDRKVDPEYIEFSYKTQFNNMKTYDKELNPDSYYIVYNNDGKYKFFQYKDGDFSRKKGDKYIKESYDDDDAEELLNNLKTLSGEMSRLNTLSQAHRRQFTPQELIEDYFLEFKDSEKYNIDIDQKFYLISVFLRNSVNKKDVELEFSKIVSKLESIKKRLWEIDKYKCQFEILIGGKSQNVYNPKTYKNDIYEYQGFGDADYGFIDGKYISYTDRDKYPKDMTPIDIKFFLV